MTDFAFVQINHRDWINFLVVDVDRPDAEMWVWHTSIPAPHWVIVNPANGHAQAGWMIEPVFTGKGAASAPARFAEAVQRSLCNATGGDPAFGRHLVRNPIAEHPAGEVRFSTRVHPYSLGELKEHMCSWRDPFDPDAGGVWNPRHTTVEVTRQSAEEISASTGRNCAIFYSLRAFLWRHRCTDPNVALRRAQELNHDFQEPLPAGEVACIARSAIRQVQAGKGRPRDGERACKFLQDLGRRGGLSRSEAKVAAARRSIASATAARSAQAAELAQRAVELRETGSNVREIAIALERSERTIHNYLAAARERDAIREATGSQARPALSTLPVARALQERIQWLLQILVLVGELPMSGDSALLVARDGVAVDLAELSRWVI